MDLKKKIISIVKKQYPIIEFPMEYKTPIQLLVSVILSAQCTDERVNIVTKDLFKKYRTVDDFADAKQGILEMEIRSTGFYHNKARNIILSARMIRERFNKKMPKKMDELLLLPGVARKTANIVLGRLYNIQSGIVVDTHVIRVAPRLGLSKERTAEKIESDLMRIVDKKDWISISSKIKMHGQKICKPRPLCEICFLNKICPSAFKVKI